MQKGNPVNVPITPAGFPLHDQLVLQPMQEQACKSEPARVAVGIGVVVVVLHGFPSAPCMGNMILALVQM